MICYGIIGVGGFAADWVRCIQILEKKQIARLGAAVVRDAAKYASQLEELTSRGCVVHASLQEMLDGGHGRIDIVGIPTGIPYHAEMAMQAMEAGYNVLVEKPVAATIQEVLRLQETERRTGRWCAVGYQFIHSPTIQWLREKIIGGRLGSIQEARSMIGWPRGPGYYARNGWAGRVRAYQRWVLDGPATNATAHHLTNMLYLIAANPEGSAISSVRAELYRAKPIPSYDTSCIEVRMSCGARALHSASHALSRTLDPVMDVICQNGSIHWEARPDAAEIRYNDGSSEAYANPDPSANPERSFTQAARLAAGHEQAPLCGLAEGGPHVLAINLAFESSKGIIPISDEHTYEHQAVDGSQTMCIEGMEVALKKAQATGLTFSELNLPWARATDWVSAEGYIRFPRSEALKSMATRHGD